MNLATLSGVYENARAISNLLGDGSRIQDSTARVLASPAQRKDLVEALSRLESHLRVMGMSNVAFRDTD